MRGQRKNKWKWLILFALIGVIPYSKAYFTHVEIKNNVVTIGVNDIMIEEDFQKVEDWQPNTMYKKDVRVRNTGTVPCYIRVYVAFSDSDIPTTINYDTGKWKKGESDYWYYSDIVAPGASTTSLFTKVMIHDVAVEQLKSFDIIVYAESVQSESYRDIHDAFTGIQ